MQPTGLNEAELSLLDMNPPQERIDSFWIRQTEEIIASSVMKIQDQVSRIQERIDRGDHSQQCEEDTEPGEQDAGEDRQKRS